MDKPITKKSSAGYPSFGQIAARYSEVMLHEEYLTNSFWHYPDVNEMYNTAVQVMKMALLNLTPEPYNKRYLENAPKYTIDTINGHTMLTLAIIQKALDYKYWSNFTFTEEGYSLQEIFVAILSYGQIKANFPENTNDNSDSKEDVIAEKIDCMKAYFSFSPERNTASIVYRVSKLLLEMEYKSTPTGRLLRVADHIATSITALACDKTDIDMLMAPDNPHATKRDRENMILCDYAKNGACYASEISAIDYFKGQNIVAYDDYGFCTALLVMCTMLVNNGHWYSWRE